MGRQYLEVVCAPESEPIVPERLANVLYFCRPDSEWTVRDTTAEIACLRAENERLSQLSVGLANQLAQATEMIRITIPSYPTSLLIKTALDGNRKEGA